MIIKSPSFVKVNYHTLGELSLGDQPYNEHSSEVDAEHQLKVNAPFKVDAERMVHAKLDIDIISKGDAKTIPRT